MLRDAVAGNRVEEVRRLYEASFPKSEKKPFGFIMKKRKKGFFDVLAIEDDEKHFCGLAIMMLSGGRALLDYLAIAPDCQGRGLGSRTLQELRERYGEDKIVVEIESTLMLGGAPQTGTTTMDVATAGTVNRAGVSAQDEANKPGEAARMRADARVSDADDRLRRKAFYLRNGMVPMDFQVTLFGVDMEVLTFGTRLTFDQYHSIYAGILPKALAGKVKIC